MGAYQYKTEEAHRAHLEKRREYYSKNRDKIRERDNATARKNRKLNPERYNKHQQDFKERKAAKNETISLKTNPEKHDIRSEIMRELEAERSREVSCNA